MMGCWLMQTASGQTFSLKRMEQSTEGIILYYDLADTEKLRTYYIQVFSSHNNYASPLQKVNGDVGVNVKPGINRKIVWNAKSEMGASFAGDIQLEVRGKVFVPLVKFTSSISGSVKRTTTVPFTWTSENKNTKLSFQLYQNETLVKTFSGVANTGKTRLTLPGSLAPGSGYYFKVADETAADNFVKTNEFEIKRRFSTIIKIAPVAVAALVVVLLLPDKANEQVVGPPGPPDAKN
jgi:hypothetical protein